MKKLNVFYETKLVGSLYRDSELIYSFIYCDEWIEDENAFKLSLAMPLQKEAFGNKITLSFFENLLPEGEAKDAINKSQNIESTFDFLKSFGRDSAGAIIVSGNDKSPFDPSLKNGLVALEMKEVYQAIDEKRSVAEVIANLDPGYLSIAGAQDKFSAIVKDDKFYLPTNGSPTTHIVKVPIYRSGVKESVYNEYYCMKLACLVGLNVAKCTVLDHKQHPLYITRRFDRTRGREITRIHQQDFCQAQGFVSENKYESNGGPTLKDNYQLIKTQVTVEKRSQALFDYLDWICFNLLIGNNDSHSKNLSFLLNNGKIELAPFYDLICTAIYPKLKKDFSFVIGDRFDATRVGGNQFKLVDESLGLKVGTMGMKVKEMSEKLIEHKDNLLAEVESELPDTKIVKRISALIGKRCKNLDRQDI